ncbi:hypothetical protein KCP77_17600 [Salmonella enterica subsp. enterica]|nr:hypothetical protein KCP77_17600 [Salmonella enterica subsp. enterica]
MAITVVRRHRRLNVLYRHHDQDITDNDRRCSSKPISAGDPYVITRLRDSVHLRRVRTNTIFGFSSTPLDGLRLPLRFRRLRTEEFTFSERRRESSELRNSVSRVNLIGHHSQRRIS